MSYICNECFAKDCSNQISDEFLISQTCIECKKEKPCYSIEIISSEIETAINNYYLQIDEDADWSYYRRKGFDNPMPINNLIADLAEVSDHSAESIREILHNSNYDHDNAAAGLILPFSSDSVYIEKYFTGYVWEWKFSQFENSLKFENRFFNNYAFVHLKELFEDIENLKTLDGKKVITEVGPGTLITKIFRARIFNSDNELEKSLHNIIDNLGPPTRKFIQNGRMNAIGVAAFYGANLQQSAVNETRPPVGSTVLVGEFEITKNLRLLDLREFNKILEPSFSKFDDTFIEKVSKINFLKSLSKRLSKPVMPNEETASYLVTQAISDYLASNLNLNIDGILYPSNQSGPEDFNVVLFYKSAKIFNPSENEVEIDEFAKLHRYYDTEYHDERIPTLKLNSKTLKTYHIHWVQYTTAWTHIFLPNQLIDE